MKLNFIAVLVFAAVSSVLSSYSFAETVNSTHDLPTFKKTTAYIYSRPMLETLYRLGVEQDRKFGIQSGCTSKYNVKPFSASLLLPIDFPDDKQNPVKGVWRIRYQLERCGDSKFYNVLFMADSNGGLPKSSAYFPGSSNAGPVLIKDAMTSVMVDATVRSGLTGCKNIDVFDMRISEPAHNLIEGDKNFKGVWKEIWTFKICGQMVDSEITFIPDENGGGTTFTTGPLKSGVAKSAP